MAKAKQVVKSASTNGKKKRTPSVVIVEGVEPRPLSESQRKRLVASLDALAGVAWLEGNERLQSSLQFAIRLVRGLQLVKADAICSRVVG